MSEKERGGVMDNLCQAHYFQDLAMVGGRELYIEKGSLSYQGKQGKSPILE